MRAASFTAAEESVTFDGTGGRIDGHGIDTVICLACLVRCRLFSGGEGIFALLETARLHLIVRMYILVVFKLEFEDCEYSAEEKL